MQLPARRWLAEYHGEWLRADVAAGITLAAYLLPAAIGDASLAGLPPEAGLYSCLFGGLVFWLFCSSRQTALTITSAISLLIGSTLVEISGGDPVRHGVLAAFTALMVAAFAFTAYLARAGAIVNFFSETVLVGFKCGVAFLLASSQLPKLFGFSASHGDFWEAMIGFSRGIGKTNAAALTLGLVSLAVLLLGKQFMKQKPVSLFVVIGAVAAARVFHLDARGVALLGQVPQGLPRVTLPLVSRADANTLIPLAMACFVLSVVETTAIGRMFASKHGYRLDATEEFLAIGSANLAAGLGGGLPVSGGMSQSLVNDGAGARTPLSGLVAALITLVIVVFFTGLLRNLPQPALAAIILVAVTGLVQVDTLRHIWRFSRAEFGIAAAAFLGVLASSLLNGVLLGVALSLLLLVRRASRPRVIEVGRVPGTSYFADLDRHPENESVPGVLVARTEGALLYFNVVHVEDRMTALLRARSAPPRLVVFFMGNVPYIDLAGGEFLVHLQSTLKDRGIELRLAEVHGQVREALRRLGDAHAAALAEGHQTVEEVLRRWHGPPVPHLT
jgi:sulfate permease, SulP family